MNLIELFIGIILGIVIKRLKRVLVISILLVNTFVVLKIIHPNLYLLPYDQWSIENLVHGVTYWEQGILIFLLSGLIFYILIPGFIKYKYYQHFYKIARVYRLRNHRSIKAIAYRICLPIIKTTLIIQEYIPKWMETNTEEETTDESVSIFLESLIIIIHTSLLSLFLFESNSILFIVLLIVALYHIIIMPVVFVFESSIKQIVKEYPNVQL